MIARQRDQPNIQHCPTCGSDRGGDGIEVWGYQVCYDCVGSWSEEVGPKTHGKGLNDEQAKEVARLTGEWVKRMQQRKAVDAA